MRRLFVVFLAVLVAVAFATVATTNAVAAEKKKIEKYGVDQRALDWKGKKWSTSKDKIRWRMSDPWGGLIFHDISIHFADSVRAASGGRLDIKVFQSGAIVPAMEIFDAVSKGTLDVAHSWPGYWNGRNEAFVAFASVPFGLDFEGYNIWYYERGGQQMLNELYGKYGIVSFFCGNVGQELGLHSNKKATKMEDFKGMKIRTPGWYMDILNLMGASVTPLPGSEIYLALERGVIDAAEFSSPAVNLPMGLQDITKYIIMPGVHQPSCQFDVFFNKAKFDALPDDLKAIIEICAKETQIWTNAWQENLNIKAIDEIGKKSEYIVLEKETIIEFAKTTKKYIDGLKAQYPDVKKVMDSQEKFKKDFAKWRELRGGVAPWPYETFIEGKLTQ
jgi:TRAP-type mannitol/chloroaromatic compound transport system substrate-binding protein